MTTMEKRIRISSVLVVLGLLLECGTFLWKSPLAFFLFLFGACGLAAAGIALFLVSLVTVNRGES